MPTRQLETLDIEHIPLKPGETVEQALARVREAIGRKISDTPLGRGVGGRADARPRRPQHHIAQRQEMLNAYKATQQRFWDEVRSRPDAVNWLNNRGLSLDATGAARLRAQGDLAPEQVRVSLDHVTEKAIDPRQAFNADNLQMEFQDANSAREIKQMRHPEQRQTPTATSP